MSEDHERARDDDGELPARPFPSGEAGGPEFDRLFRIVCNRAYDVALQRTDHHTADDIAQDVGLDFWRAWFDSPANFSDDTALHGWVARAARANVLDRLRTARLQAPRHFRFEIHRWRAQREWMDPDAGLDLQQLEQVLGAAIAAMPKRRREVMQARREEGATCEEAAEQLGLAVDTVKFHFKLGLAQLRDTVAEYLATSRVKSTRALKPSEVR